MTDSRKFQSHKSSNTNNPYLACCNTDDGSRTRQAACTGTTVGHARRLRRHVAIVQRAGGDAIRARVRRGCTVSPARASGVGAAFTACAVCGLTFERGGGRRCNHFNQVIQTTGRGRHRRRAQARPRVMLDACAGRWAVHSERGVTELVLPCHAGMCWEVDGAYVTRVESVCLGRGGPVCLAKARWRRQLPRRPGRLKDCAVGVQRSARSDDQKRRTHRVTAQSTHSLNAWRHLGTLTTIDSLLAWRNGQWRPKRSAALVERVRVKRVTGSGGDRRLAAARHARAVGGGYCTGSCGGRRALRGVRRPAVGGRESCTTRVPATTPKRAANDGQQTARAAGSGGGQQATGNEPREASGGQRTTVSGRRRRPVGGGQQATDCPRRQPAGGHRWWRWWIAGGEWRTAGSAQRGDVSVWTSARHGAHGVRHRAQRQAAGDWRARPLLQQAAYGGCCPTWMRAVGTSGDWRQVGNGKRASESTSDGKREAAGGEHQEAAGRAQNAGATAAGGGRRDLWAAGGGTCAMRARARQRAASGEQRGAAGSKRPVASGGRQARAGVGSGRVQRAEASNDQRPTGDEACSSGEWRVLRDGGGCSRRRVSKDVQRATGLRRRVHGQRPAAPAGVQREVGNQRKTAPSERREESGVQLEADSGQPAAGSGKREAGGGRRAAGSGQQTAGSGQSAGSDERPAAGSKQSGGARRAVGGWQQVACGVQQVAGAVGPLCACGVRARGGVDHPDSGKLLLTSCRRTVLGSGVAPAQGVEAAAHCVLQRFEGHEHSRTYRQTLVTTPKCRHVRCNDLLRAAGSERQRGPHAGQPARPCSVGVGLCAALRVNL
ncbi:hypothetical protein GGX14DRAFT_660083 [Mycena pura]|uniref:Uncharacterized protein n=1 Tax=Mycena pura TaxID=153505 RepID=A0AAD6V1X0_9AGAR|nr:hypothetical protein GGX14DRAFT_660083 [Mycena pura]